VDRAPSLPPGIDAEALLRQLRAAVSRGCPGWLRAEREDLAQAAALRIRLFHGAEVHADLRRRVSDLGPDGSLSVLVEPSLLPDGGTVRLEIEAGPGGAARPMFRQTLRIVPSE